MIGRTNRAKEAGDAIDGISHLEDVQDAIEKVRDALGVSHLAYHATSVEKLTAGGPFIVTTYDPVWVRRYIEKQYQNLDPVVLQALHGFLPIDWRMLDFSGRQRAEFMAEAKEFDISPNGMTIPVRGPAGEHALVSINAADSEEDWDVFLEEMRSELLLISHILHNKIRVIEGLDQISARINLSTREVDVLYWLAHGKTFEDAADILYISSRTVRAHIESARYKLNAVNTTNAVAKAVSLGLIPPLSIR